MPKLTRDLLKTKAQPKLDSRGFLARRDQTPKQRFAEEVHQFHAGTNLLQETGMSQNKAAQCTQLSSDSQQSVMAQLLRIRRLADEQGLRVAQEYEDEGDGGTTADRPGFHKMMDDALSALRPFDTIIVHDLSRFPANPYDLPRYRDQLREAEVRLLSATETAGS